MMTTSYRNFNYTYLLKIRASCCEKVRSMQAMKYTERGFIRNLFQKFLEIAVMISTNQTKNVLNAMFEFRIRCNEYGVMKLTAIKGDESILTTKG